MSNQLSLKSIALYYNDIERLNHRADYMGNYNGLNTIEHRHCGYLLREINRLRIALDLPPIYIAEELV